MLDRWRDWFGVGLDSVGGDKRRGGFFLGMEGVEVWFTRDTKKGVLGNGSDWSVYYPLFFSFLFLKITALWAALFEIMVHFPLALPIIVTGCQTESANRSLERLLVLARVSPIVWTGSRKLSWLSYQPGCWLGRACWMGWLMLIQRAVLRIMWPRAGRVQPDPKDYTSGLVNVG